MPEFYFPPQKMGAASQPEQTATQREEIFVLCPSFIRNKMKKSFDGSYKKLIILKSKNCEQAFVRQECYKYQSIEEKQVYVGMFQLRAKDFGSVNFSYNGNDLEHDSNWELLYTIKKELTDEQKEDVKKNLKRLHKNCKQYKKFLITSGKLQRSESDEKSTTHEPEASQNAVAELSNSIESTIQISSHENASREEKPENIEKASEKSAQKVVVKKSTKIPAKVQVGPPARLHNFQFGRKPLQEQPVIPLPRDRNQPSTSSAPQTPRHRFHFDRMAPNQDNSSSASTSQIDLKRLHKNCKQYTKFLITSGKLQKAENEEKSTTQESEASQNAVSQLTTEFESTIRLSSSETPLQPEQLISTKKSNQNNGQKTRIPVTMRTVLRVIPLEHPQPPIVPQPRLHNMRFTRHPPPGQRNVQNISAPIRPDRNQPSTSSAPQTPRHRFHFDRMAPNQGNSPSASTSQIDNNSNEDPEKGKGNNNNDRGSRH